MFECGYDESEHLLIDMFYELERINADLARSLYRAMLRYIERHRELEEVKAQWQRVEQSTIATS